VSLISSRKQGFKQQALQVSTDPEHRFDLALQIGDLQTALELARESENPQKWSQLADVATNQNQFELVKECLGKANDFGGLLLLASSAGDANMIRSLGESSIAQGRHNISFLSMFLLGDLDSCLDILINTNRLPEAAFFARTYIPSKISYVVQQWRNELAKVNEKAGQSLADPEQYENLFPGLPESLKAEQYLLKEKTTIPARAAKSIPLNIERNAMAEMKAAESSGAFDYDPNYDPSNVLPLTKTSQQINAHQISTKDNLIDISSEQLPPKERTPPLVKRKNSLDDFELEIEGITLDDNIDTSDVNIDDDLLSD